MTTHSFLERASLAVQGLVLAFIAAASPVAIAQTPQTVQPAWPTRSVTFIVAAGAGSSVDVFARLLAERLQAALGQTFIVENRAGASGTIGTQAVARAKPDGYTYLFAGNSVLVINPLMAKDLPYNIEKDFVAVAPVSYVPLVIAVPVDHPAKTIQQLISMSKDKESFFATPGAASLSRLIGENINTRAGTRFVNVPYPTGGAAQTDVIGGRVPVLIDGLGGAGPHAKAGRLRLLAVSTATRAKEFPDVPSLSEAIPGFAVPGINSLVAPAGTPPAILDLLNKEIRKITEDKAIVDKFATMGGDAASGSRAELEKTLADQRVLFKKLIETANIKAD